MSQDSRDQMDWSGPRADPDGQGRYWTTSANAPQDESPTTSVFNPYCTHPRAIGDPARTEHMDRKEIIRKIKERGSVRQQSRHSQIALDEQEIASPIYADMQRTTSPPVLLAAPRMVPESERISTSEQEWTASGLSLSRPRSALHSGDFRGAEHPSSSRRHVGISATAVPQVDTEFVATSPPAPWHDGFSDGIQRTRRSIAPLATPSTLESGRQRATSTTSLSKSFSYQAPTSPLVQQANADDLHLEDDSSHLFQIADLHDRRRTFTSPALHSFGSLKDRRSSMWSSSPPTTRRETTVPYQAHQPRRSISSLHSTPQTPQLGSRRASLISSSPIQQAMVGSFEESILRGRMSSTPSQPLDFTANIGVLGMGNCKPYLKCPPHAIIPFPAVFYNYGHDKINSDPQPSPYVGLVDLENAAATNDLRSKRLKMTTTQMSPPTSPRPEESEPNAHRRKRQRENRRLHLDDPKGGYRIPPKGQLQVIIKNPNKTAVKLFLVPYDVSDIQPGQKTFLRQRSYSSGPVIDMPLGQRRNLGTDRPEASLSYSNDPHDRPVLRYLIHMHICCTSRGHIYLYGSIRVVFANRVPDEKEKLRNEIQLPEPKYSSYRPGRTSTNSTPSQMRPVRSPTSALFMDVDMPISPGSVMPVAVPSRRPEAHSLPAVSVYERLLAHRPHESTLFQHTRAAEASSGHVIDQDYYDSKEQPVGRGFGAATNRNDIAEADRDDHTVSVASRMKSPTSPLSPLMSPILQRAISPSVTDSSEGTGSFTFSRSSSTERLQSSLGSKTESLLSKRLRDFDMGKGSG